MSVTIIVHLVGEEAIMCEVDQLPNPDDTNITVMNVRKRDGKDVNFLEATVRSVIMPLARINFIEVMQTGEEEEKVVSFVRD
jgi:hypothetical protein